MNDKKLAKFLIILLLLPLTLAYFSGDKFRYPCQDPANWDKDICKLPLCDVTRTCPQHIFLSYINEYATNRFHTYSYILLMFNGN